MSDSLWLALAGAGGTLLGAVARGLAQTRVASAVARSREGVAAAETDRAPAPVMPWEIDGDEYAPPPREAL